MKQLQASQPVTQDGKRPSAALVEILQEMAREIETLKARVKALEES